MTRERAWMSGRSRPLGAGVLSLAASLLAAPPAFAEDADPVRSSQLTTSLVWIFGDDDVLHAPGDATPPSPAAGLGDRPGYDELFEGFASRYTGRENRSELLLDATAPGLAPRLTTRARLALGLDAASLGVRGAPLAVEDAGSFVEVAWQLGPDPAHALALRAYPLNGDRQRVGHLEALAWGGATGPRWDSPYASADGPARALVLELRAGFVVCHLGLKTANFLEPEPSGPALDETSYGWFGGVESRWSAPIGVAFELGHFEHGRLPGGSAAPRATTTGASLRVHAELGLREALPPVGFGLEPSPFDASSSESAVAEAPRHAANERAPVRAPSGGARPATSGVAFAVEGAHLVERRWDFDRPGRSALAPARGAAAVLEARAGRLDVRALVSLREPSFVLRSGPGVFPSETIPRAAAERSELGVAAGVGLEVHHAVRAWLAAGVLWPAALTTGAVDARGRVTGAMLVVRGPGDVEALPPGAGAVPVLAIRPTCALSLSRLLEGVVWAQYRRDFDRTRLVAVNGGALARGFQSPDRLGYGLALRAVW